jgi:redox-sensitive bicupin YhaK (pirin superfamily)
VLLGSYEGKTSPIESPVPITYLHVRLRDGERWSYNPAVGHDVAWLALNSGRLWTSGTNLERELAVFADGGEPIDLLAEGPTEFVLGSAAKHPHQLVTGYYSVHTNQAALALGERTISDLRRTPAVEALYE